MINEITLKKNDVLLVSIGVGNMPAASSTNYIKNIKSELEDINAKILYIPTWNKETEITILHIED